MLYTREWVEEKYNYYNKLIWGGELPSFNSIEFSIIKTKKLWGRAGCKSWGRDLDGIPYAKQPILQLSNYLDAPEWAKLNTLVHEMCHLYEFFCDPKYILDVFKRGRYNSNYPKHGHGTIFFEQARRVESICGIEITRYVSQERLASASLSDEIRTKAQGKIDRNGGIDMMLLITRDRSKTGSRFAYCKPNINALSAWRDFLNNRPESANRYFTAAALCKSFNPEAEHIPVSRKVNWYYMDGEIDAFIKKYDIAFSEIFMGNRSDFGGFESENNSITIAPQEKRYKSFTLKFTSGKILRYTDVTKDEVAKKLRKEFPKWPDTTIDKFVNNDELYMEGKNNRDSLEMIIERAVRKEIKKRMQDNPEIEPFSDEEMSRLTGFTVSD